MLFNSLEFLFVFLPATVAVFFLLGRTGNSRLALGWLTLASLFFYGWWNPRYLGLILGSILFNYVVSVALRRSLARGTAGSARLFIVLGISVDLALLAYFKYSAFLLGAAGASGPLLAFLHGIVLPLGISFFTFTQIAYLVDTYKGIARENDFLSYCLFVTYFPHLIAGPLLHHHEFMPQLGRRRLLEFSRENLAAGIAILMVGLIKKLVLADNFALHANPVFEAADAGAEITFFEAWVGTLAYTFQLYFDFSGYSDMAIGASRMLGIALPQNFSAPYKASSLVEFWRRWHMTLSRFLKEYLYVPLGGSRKGPARRYANILVTMLLGGLWHGANWTFVLWGALHGLGLVANHGARAVLGRLGWDPGSTRLGRIAGVLATFLFVAIAWSVFRSGTLAGARHMLDGLLGLNGFVLPQAIVELWGPLKDYITAARKMELLGNGTLMGVLEISGLLALGAGICWFAPRTCEMTPRQMLVVMVLCFAFVVQSLFFGRAPAEFLYYQF
jgi:D-alanyl-lipoteichoic acid acyltransferase DltB (MBOAT superfamily)